jgi:hypothetical protein
VYWIKLTYFRKHWKVVAFDVDMPVEEALILTEISRRTEAGELQKLPNQVRLVEVAAFHGNIGPIRRCLQPVDNRPHPLKSVDPAEQLRRHAYFRFKNLYKTALAEPDISRNVPNGRVNLPSEAFKRGRNRVMMFQRAK